MKIILVRHAQSHWQTGRSDDLDTALTERGRSQAAHLAEFICTYHNLHESDYRVGTIVSSPLQRARQTANYLSDRLRLPVTLDENLREADFHVADHLPRRSSPQEDAEPFAASPEYTQLKGRANLALASLYRRTRDTGAATLAVTHGGLLKTMLRCMCNTDHICCRLHNASVSVIEWRHGRWYIEHMNRLEHIPNDLRTC